MNLLPDEEQNEIISQSASFLASEMPIARLRELFASGELVDEKVWKASAELGWFALGVSEEAGGVGATLADEALLFREIGRGLAPGPLLSTTLGARVAVASGQTALATEVIEGQTQIGLAVLEPGAELRKDRLVGSLRLVDAEKAPLVLVATETAAALVSISELGTLVEERCIDDATHLARADGVDAPLTAFVEASQDPIALRGLILSAAQLVGIAEACRDLGSEHAKNRVQFDRPIGVHQAIKHPCADMAIRAEAAFCQTMMAAVLLDEGREDAVLQANSARVVAGDAAEKNAATTTQVLGGMGFTFEADVHLYIKRTQVLRRVISSTDEQLKALVEV
jgi:alkylation response protein AidB-like acyl-CoA dehydrogenase